MTYLFYISVGSYYIIFWSPLSIPQQWESTASNKLQEIWPISKLECSAIKKWPKWREQFSGSLYILWWDWAFFRPWTMIVYLQHVFKGKNVQWSNAPKIKSWVGQQVLLYWASWAQSLGQNYKKIITLMNFNSTFKNPPHIKPRPIYAHT